MADLLELLSNEEDTPHDRFGDIIEGFCGGGCHEGELIISGTGETIPIPPNYVLSSINGSMKNDDPEITEREYVETTNTGFFSLEILLMAFLISLMLGLVFLRVVRQSNNRERKETQDLNQEPSIETEEFSSDIVEDLLLDRKCAMGSEVCNGLNILSDGPLPKIVSAGNQELMISNEKEPAAPNRLSIDRQVVEESTSLTLCSEVQLKQYGKEFARNLTTIMAEFETTMKDSGYTVSQSEALAIASQRLQSIEQLRLAQEQEARHYLYDSQQRNLNRFMEERRHAESMQAHEQDQNWFQKLQKARDDCLRSIFPSIQRSIIALALCYVAYYFYEFRDVISIGMIGKAAVKIFVKLQAQLSVWEATDIYALQSTEYSASTASGGLFPIFSIAWQVIQGVSQIWKFAVFLVFGISIYAIGKFLLPKTVIEFGKTGFFICVFLRSISTTVPWKALCLGQIVFWLIAQIWTMVLFGTSLSQLNRLKSPPSNQDLLPHLYRFDHLAQTTTVVACILNVSIIICCHH